MGGCGRRCRWCGERSNTFVGDAYSRGKIVNVLYLPAAVLSIVSSPEPPASRSPECERWAGASFSVLCIPHFLHPLASATATPALHTRPLCRSISVLTADAPLARPPQEEPRAPRPRSRAPSSPCKERRPLRQRSGGLGPSPPQRLAATALVMRDAVVAATHPRGRRTSHPCTPDRSHGHVKPAPGAEQAPP